MFTDEHLRSLESIFRSVCEDFETELVEFNGEADHVHLLVNFPPKVSVSKLVKFANLAELPGDLYTWSLLGTLGVVHTGVVFILMYGAIQRLPTHVTGALSFIYPVMAILVDRIAFGHHLQPAQLAGIAAVLLAAAGMTLGWTLVPRRRAVSTD